jgi:dihydrofolate synthase/folylpolyglutamate synthase
MRFDSLAAWLDWQESCHPREIELGLDRIREVAQRLDLLQPAETVITVAGTNGKGSCIATLEALLIAQGQKAGAYTSPHLLRYNERVRIGAEAVSDEDFCSAFAAIDEARGDITLTYFEFGTLAAFWLFRRAQLDYWLLEVGLGGRLDATNLLDADVAIVTTIAIDHQQWLGNDRETIGREKAGIFRKHHPVVCADRQIPASVLAHAAALECPVFLAGREFDWQSRDGDGGWSLHLSKAGNAALHLPLPKLPLPSVAAAVQALTLIDRMPSSEVVADLLATLQLPGRFQQLSCAGKDLFLDVAHNPAAAEYLAQCLDERGVRQLAVVVAMMADKDIEACLRPLRPFVRHWWLAALPDVPRAAEPSVLQDALARLGVGADQMTLCSSVEETVKWLLTEMPDNRQFAHDCDSLLVTGSFYTVSAALQVCGECSI